ncbi:MULTISPECIES: TusE/DsrC/DsvC family sulfur relay protein [Microbulbifer]|uniref:TusE/DsrC/DsvC family sulfur relay protein n=1 Tax=Microbulbifer TaxID=48073 RepID=UPI001E5957EC|nr:MULTISPECIES: TusE/DsrC/DsvC family sulfur relay protein [Microbulbifer]UHQ55591.1 TusE/DsrC/DsvC family sulfur relay protein [Microbulbifer sp. YPW16]
MGKITIEGRDIPLDKEGFLRNRDDWSPAVAEALAQAEGIELTGEHWEVIRLLQDFYREFELSPAMRPLVKYVALHLGPDKGRSIYLMRLFPESPAKLGSKIAGLPKPTNCL